MVEFLAGATFIDFYPIIYMIIGGTIFRLCFVLYERAITHNDIARVLII